MMNRFYISLSFFVVVLASCEQVIDIDLNTADPKIVVEANISTLPGPYTVKLSRTLNFDDANNFPPLTGAFVVIADDTGLRDTLTETSPGIYSTNYIQGAENRMYTLTVIAGPDTLTATSMLYPRVLLDSLHYSLFSGFGGSRFLVTPYFHDPASLPNYYKFVLYKNGVDDKRNIVMTDAGVDGLINAQSFITGKMQYGDTLRVEMRSVDKPVYDYYYSLLKTSGSILNQGATPGNPVSNIQCSNCLGYFSAYSLDTLTVILQ